MPIRDGGGKFTINNPDDGTPIKEMFKLDDGLLMITEKCTYRMQLADQIDPDRRNSALAPTFQQKLFDHGTDSDLLCRTLLQGRVMFRKEFQNFDVDRAMQITFEALGDLVAMHETAQVFSSAEQAAIEKASRLDRRDASQTLAAVGNVRGHCKTFMQKADHFAVSLFGLVRLFYPDMRSKGGWDSFHETLKTKYGESDPFYKVSELATPLLKLIRNARDCLEHGNLKGVETSDFAPRPDGVIEYPWIKIDYRGTSHERCPISWFMKETTRAILESFEMIIVHSCAKRIEPFAGMPMSIALLPESVRKSWHVRFAYGMHDQDGTFVPCG
jgi:hypothetical protein